MNRNKGFGRLGMSPQLFRAALCLMAIMGMSVIPLMTAKAEVIEVDKARLFGYPSTDEDVGLSFLKMAGIENPEFEKLIVRTDKFKTLNQAEKQPFLKEEIPRLYNKFVALNPQSEGILIRLRVEVLYAKANGATPAKLEIKFPSQGMVYFPFYYGGLPIAVIPNGIENFTEILLTEREAVIVNGTLDMNPETTLILDLKPVFADAKKPMVLDGEAQFPLLCEIGYIGLHNRNTDQIWAWGSEENMTKGRKDPVIEIIKPKIVDPF